MTDAPQYAELDQFLGGYFNEDFASYAPTWEGVVDFYVAESSTATVRSALDQLEKLLATDDDELRAVVTAMGPRYDHHPLSRREWLEAVRDRLWSTTNDPSRAPGPATPGVL